MATFVPTSASAEERDIASSSAEQLPDKAILVEEEEMEEPFRWWQDAVAPILLVLLAHLALGFATELFYHQGAHVGIRE